MRGEKRPSQRGDTLPRRRGGSAVGGRRPDRNERDFARSHHPGTGERSSSSAAFVAGDMEWLNEHLHENIVWHAAGRSSLAGEFRGREQVLASFAKSVQIAMPAFEIHDVAGARTTPSRCST